MKGFVGMSQERSQQLLVFYQGARMWANKVILMTKCLTSLPGLPGSKFRDLGLFRMNLRQARTPPGYEASIKI